MSRVGRKSIDIPAGVEVEYNDAHITVKGPKGTLSRQIYDRMVINIEGNVITVDRPTDNKIDRSMHGTTRTLIANMVNGVSEGFSKTLELVGVGYRANLTGNKVVLNVGFSHPVEIEPESGIDFEVPSATKIIIKGIDKELVGSTAAKIRMIRKPEPYKGKGIKYEGERILRKEGKSGSK